MTDKSPGGTWLWVEEFDLSQLTYQRFLNFFFDRPVVGDKAEYELFRGGIDYFVASKPAIVVAHLRAMCQDLPALTKIYSSEQLNQGLWAVFGAAISCDRWLFDPSVARHLRVDCIESMYVPFRDVLARSNIGKWDSFYFMWWDMILHTFWERYGQDVGAADDAKRILDAIYQTLLKILALDHPACQWSALHGLGHLRHPGVRPTVQNYLDLHRSELNDEDREWLEQCREGRNA